MSPQAPNEIRNIVFISKATPEDDEFVLWLAPKLEAAGYEVFSDILVLQGGDRWRKVITDTLQDKAIKMLLCCRNTSLEKTGVQEEIGIGLDLAKSLPDPNFVLPLRLEPYKRLFGIGELQYTDFVRGWAEGLKTLLKTLQRQRVPRKDEQININPNWEAFRRRRAVGVRNDPERLTSNWLRVVQAREKLHYFEPLGAVDPTALKKHAEKCQHPIQLYNQGLLTFCSFPEISEYFVNFGRFTLKHKIPLMAFVQGGHAELGIVRQDASNMVSSMWRQAWNQFCRDNGLRQYNYSSAAGFHASNDLLKIGQRVPWGRQGERRSSMLRNVAKGHVWEFGVTAYPNFWPYPHYKLKSRVLFSPLLEEQAGEPIDDAKKQHRLRRSVCKGWRNKQWHGRMLAFLELLSKDSAFVKLPLSLDMFVKLEASPVLFTSPVTTTLPDVVDGDDEEQDETTLGRPEPEEFI